MTATTQRNDLAEPTNQTDKAHIFKHPGQRIFFESGYYHYLHPAALAGVDQLSIRGLKDAEIYFLGPLTGSVEYEASWRPDSGLLNLVDCRNVLVSGLGAENNRQFRSGDLRSESSCVVNVEGGDVKLVDCAITSNGKIAVTAHSGGKLVIEDSSIHGYYHEFLNGGAELTVRRCDIVQEHVDPDSHSLLFVSSSPRHAITGQVFENSYTLVEDCDIRMQTGRALVAGTGSDTTRSHVEIRNCEIHHEYDTFGIAVWHTNYRSLEVVTSDSLVRDYIETPESGFAKFVNYYGKSKESLRPSGPDSPSPIWVNGVSSADV